MAESSPCLPHIIIIPGLPHDLALMILVRIPRALHGSLRCVSRAWRDALQPLVVSALRSSLGISEMWFILRSGLSNITFCDPLLRGVSEPTCLSCLPSDPLCSCFLASFIQVLGALGSQVFFLTHRDYCRPLNSIIIHCFDAASMRVQYDFVDLNMPMRSHFASAAFDGHVYVAGGFNNQKQYSEAARVNVKTRTWEPMPDMHKIRVEATAVVMQGCLYVIGGRSNRYDVHSGEIWDPKRQEWILEPELWPAHLFTSYEQPKVAVLLDTLYALRRSRRTSYYELMRYERVSKLWTSLGPCMCCGVENFIGAESFVGAGNELWVVMNCKQLVDVIMSCVPPTGTQPLRWRLVTQIPRYGSMHGHVLV